MGWGDLVPDDLEELGEKGAEKLGEGIDWAGDKAADGLDELGWERGVNLVREGSGSLANRMGADVDELELGQTDDPRKLVHGSVGKIRATVSHLRDFTRAFDNVGQGLRGLDSGAWKGEAADAFRTKAGLQPPKWFRAAQACRAAAETMDRFADTVKWAQDQAQEAVDAWRAAEKATRQARTAHETAVDRYDEAVRKHGAAALSGRDPGPEPERPGDFSDPGESGRRAAREKLAEARRQRDAAAEEALAAVARARQDAPARPSYGEQLKDGLMEGQLRINHFNMGMIRGSAGVVSFARGLNPFDPHNLTHPGDYLTNLNNTAAGLVQTANDPLGAGRQMYEQFMRDPAEGSGRLVPELLATRGAGAARKGLGAARDLADNPGRTTLRDNGPHDSKTPDSRKNSQGVDPVDLATGRMYLPQTDVSLPGALPLVFRRRVESGYRAGRWFGPSWSSTVDQRLEVDAEGVVLIGEDGLILAYPHPAPGVSTLPEAGPRWPLERTPDGGYTLTDPETGCVRHFAPPAGAEPGGDGVALLEQLTDRNGNWITFAYDEATGAPVRIEHSGGYVLHLTVEDGHVTALSLAAPDGTAQPVMRYGYSDTGDLTEVINSSGRPLRFEYDEHRRVTAWIDSNDRRYDYVYDERHRVVAEGGEGGHFQVILTYDDIDPATGHHITTVTTAEGHATRHLIDDARRTVATTDPTGATTRFAYDDRDRPLTHTDPLDRTTRFEYDESGHLVRLTRPDGREVVITRNELGLPTEVREPDGAAWRHTYDERGNRTATTDPAGATTHYAYDTHGHLTAVTNALGETTSVRCDAAGLPVEITDPLGAVTRYTRDAFGRPTALTDPLGAVTRLAWSTEGKLTHRTGPDGADESWEYDGEGNCVRHTDPAGNTTVFEYTHFDLLAARTDPDGTRYEFEHDAALRLTGVTNPQGLTWRYVYDPAGRLTAETDFDDRTVTYTHDGAGQLTARTTPLGETITFAYDELGLLARKDAAGAVTTYERDLAGRPLRITGPDTDLTYQRDKLGRVKTEMAGGRVLTFSYDALGRRTRRTTPTGQVTTYTYDAAGNRTTLTTGGRTLDFTHDPAGRETTRRIGDVTLTQLWDPAGRLTDQTLTSPETTVQHRSYHYRADGYLTAVDDLLTGHRTFDLDPAGRVTAVHAQGWTETYAYDTAGNQTSAAWPTTHAAADATGQRTYTGTRLTQAGRTRYEHDDAGRLTLRQRTRLSRKPDTWRYTWDTEDRLTTVTTPDGTRWRYLYDPLGRRTAKQRLTHTGEVAEQIDFTWDGPVLIEQTTTTPDLPHPVTLTWDHHGLHPITQTERLVDEATQTEIDARFFAIVTDLVGTPTELIDDTGHLAWHTRTTLWGTTTWNRDATTYTPLRFPGQYHDPETGLHYNYFRYYDPTTARYLTPDPLGLAPAPNPTTYPHNPHTRTDPLGLAPYPNQMPEELAQELADAERLGVRPLRVGDEGFDAAVNSGTIKWAVDEQGRLFVIPKYANGVELKHPVLTGGRPVLAAGEAEIAGSDGSYFGMEINNMSGHYKPSMESLQVGREAFERAGISFLE
ncbi:type IV secretion protein Rhs [Streptomyces carminius]|uniref:Type IV secretion protein Rhs n=1 Tax=Streptomyces carminius TaxID=2665496 RepID=A0A2M8LX64_9ACTN|nr:DUF6531 domain-containing protein [Streptomyces carminius]PJE96542.1 type IV secretion protein Rhs [Streptomyces carminius]